MHRFVGLAMAATLLAAPLSLHALTLKKGETIESGDKSIEMNFDKPVSLKSLRETDPQVIKQFKENSYIENGELHFTLGENSFQNKYDKEEVVDGDSRKQSQRSELRYTLSGPEKKSVTMSFRFRTKEAYQISERVLIAQIKTLTTSRYRRHSQPNVSVYAERGGYVACVEWETKASETTHTYHRRKLKLNDGHLTDSKWHHVVMEFTPNTDNSEGLCRVIVDGVTQLEMKGHSNLPHGLRRDKFHMNIGPYRDKTSEEQTFIYDDWEVEIRKLKG